jgi:hypothetical protein
VPLTLVAEAETVRVLHGTVEVAAHPRSYEAEETVEAPEHLAGLVAAKRQAAPLTRRDRLRQVVPAVATLFERLAGRGEALGPHVTRLHALLDDYGAAELATAVATALDRDACGAGSVAYFLERRRRTLRQLPPVPVVLPVDPRVRDLDVTAHALESSDALIDAPELPEPH